MIYYTGIGSNKLSPITSDKVFRDIILINQHNFNELCTYDPATCDIDLLIEWTGAKIILE